MKKISYIILALVLFLCIFGLAKSSWAATITVASCSQQDVQAAVDSASDNDTVAIPQGSCTWTQNGSNGYAVIIDKPITLQGAGVGSTIITHNAGTYIPLILISLPSGKADQPVRVTGIYFENDVYCPSCGANQYTQDIWLTGKTTNFRIDHNTFHNGKSAIETGNFGASWVNGVIDSNAFVDVDGGIRVWDDSDIKNVRPTADSWGRAIQMGSSDSVFIENNTWTINNISGCSGLNENVYHNNAARSTIRYNTFNDLCTTYRQDYFDAHGLAGCDRGTVLVEMYNNAFNAVYPIGTIIGMRGGSLVAHDNAFIQPGSPTFWFENEQPYYNGDISWPSQDQPNNSFMWNNKYSTNGTNWTLITDIVCNPGFGETCESQFIRKDRDYFMHVPCGASDTTDGHGNTCTHGKETYGGSAGYSNDFCNGLRTALLPAAGGNLSYQATVPCCTGKGTGTCDMTATTLGDNAYYPYTPYTCPHPLTGYTGSCDPAVAGTLGYPSQNILYGDVSGDSIVSAYDAALVAQAAVGLITFTTDQIKAGDVSGDGVISAYDAALIAQKAVGLISKFPVEL